jgi:2-polyprenyl-3-methyl-5-hydroxy-6-metoxy-1,4-benzoquinol methylase
MNTIVHEISRQFDASSEFVEAILSSKNCLSLALEASDLKSFISSTGEAWKYISYALGTNLRSRASLDKMLALASPSHIGRALDIGCGYGGFMRAFADKGYQAHGIEIDSRLAELAKCNLGLSCPDSIVHVGDLFSGDLRLGSFDLITINDVFEHLMNPIRAFNMLSEMLNPGGILGIYAPNGKSVFYAASDPHNRVFASSFLPYPVAKLYVQSILNSSSYSLGEYFSIDQFCDLCKRNGLDFRYRSHDGGERPEHAAEYLSMLINNFNQSEFRTKIDPIIAATIEYHFWQYVKDFAEAAAKSASGNDYCEFNDKYLARAWTIVCKKG